MQPKQKIQLKERKRVILSIHWTEKALEKIKERLSGSEQSISLKYEMDDSCGCGVNGVWNLCVEENPASTEKEWKTNAYPVYIEPSHVIYLDDNVTIDYSDQTGTFQLKSPNGFLSSHMACNRKK